MSASTTVASALIGVRRVLPGGTGGGTWLSVTVEVSTGARVGVRDLFSEPARGLGALAEAARRNLVSTNPCIRASVNAPRVGPIYARGFAPTVGNYQHFALTPRGLLVGFFQEQVGGASCSSVQTTVVYAVLRPHLSRLGKRLVAGVRRPRPS
jgi:hypothetical protein